MGKAKAKGKQVKGRMKESAGKAMGDRGMRAEGRGEQIAGSTQEAVRQGADQVRKPGGR
ncbi:CsbD family protein [Streptomyces sp. NPDC002659]|uniref:CsbD family protein n=1 Tax=Streptomyces sp. NPDC002659 TaxID=3364656 RepID=UPI0036BB26E1